ncbi:MAG: peptidoglycan-binding domain-containing protein [Hyphomicrobiales bacterium]
MAFVTKTRLKTVLTIGVGLIVGAWSTQSIGQDQLPFPDGRYVTDPAYCAMSEAQIVDQLGEVAGATVRTIAGDRIINPYFGSCTVQSSSIAEGALVLSQQCSAEGETYSVVDLWEIETPTSFRDSGSLFTLCSVDSAAGSTALPSLDADDVFALQLELQGLGFNPGPPDGVMGPQTRRALTEFQSRNDLQRTGSMNAETRAALDRATTELFAGIAAEFAQRAEQSQAAEQFNSDDIFSAQVALQRLGFSPGAADGEFGSRTRQAMNDFQRRYGLEQTQALNRETLDLLVREDTALFANAETVQSSPANESELLTGSPPPDSIVRYERAMDFRDRLLADSRMARLELRLSLPVNYRSLFDDDGSLRRFLLSAFPFVGCAGHEREVLGFYNAFLDTWLIAWVANDNEIRNIELTAGFAGIEQSSTPWFVEMNDSATLSETIASSILAQSEFFYTFFGNDCIDSLSLGRFSNPQLAAERITHQIDLYMELYSPNAEFLFEVTRQQNGLGADQRPNVTFLALSGEDRFLAIQTLPEDPNRAIVQFWRSGKGRPVLERQLGFDVITAETAN